MFEDHFVFCSTVLALLKSGVDSLNSFVVIVVAAVANGTSEQFHKSFGMVIFLFHHDVGRLFF